MQQFEELGFKGLTYHSSFSTRITSAFIFCQISSFLQCTTMLHTVIAVAFLYVRKSVCLSVTRRYCVKMSERGMIFLSLTGSVIFVNENENENGEKRENNEFVNEN